MKAIILAAGYATRLYPLTEKVAKALLDVNGKPIISHITDSLYKIKELDTIYVITNDLFAKDFEIWKKENNYEKITIINDNTSSDETKLGAIGDINYVLEQTKLDDDALVIAGDTYFNFELSDFSNFFYKNNETCVCVKEEFKEDLTRFGIAEINNEIIVGIEEKPKNPKSNNIVYASYIFRKKDILKIKEYLQEGNTPDAPGNFISWLCKKEKVRAFKINGFCIDIGTHESYNNAKNIK